MEILYDFIAAVIIGLISIPIGELIPRSKVRENVFPFRPYGWEKNGEIYKKIKIQSWKDAVPDLSRIFRKMIKKRMSGKNDSSAMDRLVKETCVAETVHLGLILTVVPTILIIGGKYRHLLALLYTLGNCVFIMIQRYNRPRLIIIRDKMRKREVRAQKA